MRDRLNVIWDGRRTTARFPPELWRLALIASSQQDANLSHNIRTWIHSAACPWLRHESPSLAVRHYLTVVIENELFSAGFGSSDKVS